MAQGGDRRWKCGLVQAPHSVVQRQLAALALVALAEQSLLTT